MCNESVGLIASVIERAGIPTIGLSLLREVTERVRAAKNPICTVQAWVSQAEPIRNTRSLRQLWSCCKDPIQRSSSYSEGISTVIPKQQNLIVSLGQGGRVYRAAVADQKSKENYRHC